MSGIFTVCGHAQADFDGLRDMLAHRGPDATHSWRSDSIYLGHRQLSITNASEAASQPLHNEDSSIVLVCDGRIYNHQALRRELITKGHVFRSGSGNESILHGYEQWGQGVLDRLIGMFAFTIWDSKRKLLFAARDHAGIKPLYWLRERNFLALSSECTPLVHLQHTPIIDKNATAYYLTLGYVPTPLSIWHAIFKLEPGHKLTYEPDGEVKIVPYWSPPTHIDDAERIQEWPELWQTVCQDHMQADMPLGLFLSAGLDSSGIGAALTDCGVSSTAFIVSMPKSEDDESSIAEETACTQGHSVQKISMSGDKVAALLKKVCSDVDEPFGYGAFLNMMELCSKIPKRYKVALSGDGADEALGGYSWYANLPAPLSRRKKLLLWLCKRRPLQNGNYEAGWEEFRNRSLLHMHTARLYQRFLPEEADAMVFGESRQMFTEEAMLAPLARWFCDSLPPKRALQRIDLMTFCADACIPKVDRSSMRYSFEVRLPYLDRRMLEWGLTRPCSPAFEATPKNVLRQYLTGKVPASVLQRPKQGFSLRCLDQFDFVEAVNAIAHSRLVTDGIINEQWRLILDSLPQSWLRPSRIWALLMLAGWYEHHVSASQGSTATNFIDQNI